VADLRTIVTTLDRLGADEVHGPIRRARKLVAGELAEAVRLAERLDKQRAAEGRSRDVARDTPGCPGFPRCPVMAANKMAP